MNSKWIMVTFLIAGMGVAAFATSITDAVDNGGGWSNINGGFFSAGIGGLTPQSGANFWAASDGGGNLRGTWKLFSEAFTTNQQINVSYSVGDRNDKTLTAVSAFLFADTNGDNNYEWGERITTTSLQARTEPASGWSQWKDSYLITAGTQTADGASVVGKQVGFFIFANLASGEALSFDNFSMEISDTGSSELLLAGWDGGSGLASSATNATGITGDLWINNIYGLDATAGSTDGTYGVWVPGADTAATGYAVRTAVPGSTDTLTFRINNNSGADVTLDKLVFDYGRWFADSPADVTLTYSYGGLDIADNTVIEVVSGIEVTTKLGDYSDVTVSLARLSDHVLANGQSAAFKLVVSNAGGAYNNGAIDNIAFLTAPATNAPLTGYAGWIDDFNLFAGEAAADADPDGDGMNNLYEYGLGGNPTNDAVLGTLPLFEVIGQGGSNIVQYIHVQRTDTQSGISYSVEQTAALVPAAWTNDGFTVTGESGDVGGFKTVTNQASAEAVSKFVQLVITEQ